MTLRVGAQYINKKNCKFTIWAPLANKVVLKISYPKKYSFAMQRNQKGYWEAVEEGACPGTRYLYKLNGKLERPDPASFFQPEGVHNPSEVVDHSVFKWEDKNWKGILLEKMIIYELHVGTFTPEGTFQAAIPRFNELCQLGINAIELMPVAQFPGARNWGYDGVYPYAVQNSYGGVEGLKELVNAAHNHNIAVILDVVYNHLGPEGNYLRDFGPYFTNKYKTPWGEAINFDGAYSDEVRNFFIENALYWFREFHMDALRLDAIHGIYDMSAKPILQELVERVEEFSKQKGRKFYLIAESDLNDAKIVRSRQLGGYGIDAQWCDDFHHCLHTLLTKERSGYYKDFGKIEQLVKSFKHGFIYSWDYSEFRKRRHGSPQESIPANKFIVFSQNHDQIGNRAFGEQLSKLVNFEALKLVAAVVLTSPYIPLLFMGEEYAETAPFLYFISHFDTGLIRAVREGRKKEFSFFKWDIDPPDPQSEDTFITCKLNWEKRFAGKGKILLSFYRELIKLRKKTPALSNLNKDNMDVRAIKGKNIVTVQRWNKGGRVFSIMGFNKKEASFSLSIPAGRWQKVIDSTDIIWQGPGSCLPERFSSQRNLTIKPFSYVLYKKEEA
ncbi:MAG: malto-oligosyltrehalose trehalohydrolase [Candidatus Omnitrophica bacterium CG23_combo_of_CG06-09_8_20_14_all_40_11]|nr:MAG: malto-oligosyltrehalose trehalohydrolase [Candidatus Omnitrophica bacterium CG23_combo_of_CG06-09_8_20_14_all_40_11]